MVLLEMLEHPVTRALLVPLELLVPREPLVQSERLD